MKSYIYKPHTANSVKIFNAISGIKSLFGFDRNKEFNIDALHSIASDETNLNDFGDSAYLQGLSMFIQSIKDEPDIHYFGLHVAREMCLASLKNRLYLQNFIANNPEVLALPVHQPIWILGLPRTGTTFLHHLLAKDPDNRVVKRWEAICAAPRISNLYQDKVNRRNLARVSTNKLELLSPGILAKHSMGWNLPEECINLFCDSFCSELYWFCFGISSYKDWLKNTDLSSAYSYYKKQIQVLQAQESAKQWIFKAPFHSAYIREIEHTFDAPLYIRLHRDPNEVLPSVASLYTSVLGIHKRRIDRETIGREVYDHCLRSTTRLDDELDKVPSERVINVRYEDFVRDPETTVETIYTKFNMDLSSEFRSRIHAFVNNNPKEKHGSHKYSGSDYGFISERIDQGFNRYSEKYL